MKRVLLGLAASLSCLLMISFSDGDRLVSDIPLDSLRAVYSGSPETWPKAFVDPGVDFKELGIVPGSPIDIRNDSIRKVVELGKVLFFDPRLSGSNQVSCVSCHAPELNFTDGRQFSLGHDQTETVRNTPSLENVWFYKALFWDGRAGSLEDQAVEPIINVQEMHEDFSLLPEELSQIKGYRPLFAAAFGDEMISKDRILKSLGTFQRTLTSRRTALDKFLAGDKTSMTDQQLHGMHIFRTKGRCMNCHNGPLFTDNEFHNLGLTYYKRDKYEDLGLYNITKKPEDVGKFRTPGLRGVMRTGPWFHNGVFPDMDGIMNMYNVGMPTVKPKDDQVGDPLFPKKDPLLKPLNLTQMEKDALVAFLHSITELPTKVSRPAMPK